MAGNTDVMLIRPGCNVLRGASVLVRGPPYPRVSCREATGEGVPHRNKHKPTKRGGGTGGSVEVYY